MLTTVNFTRQNQLMPISAARIMLCIVALGSLFVSCTSSKALTDRTVYFKNISDSALQMTTIPYEPRIQKGDILYIGVFTRNEKSAQLFNQPNFYAGSERTSGGGGLNAAGPTQGYLVNEQGNIVFPSLGSMHVAGMTKQELSERVTDGLARYIDSAIVSVRLLNYRITVLGEVAAPGTYSIPSERVSILDAIGMAGDLTVYGKRSNVRIIRNTGDSLHTATLDLNRGNIFASPYFYLQPNDVVYVEMNERKIPNTDMADIRRVSLALSVLSAVGVIVGIINLFK